MRSLSAAVSALLSSSSFGGSDVLLFVHAQDFVLFLIPHQRFLGSLHLHPHVDELGLQPVRGVHGGVETVLTVVLDVGFHQGVDDIRGRLGLGAAVMNLDDAGVRTEIDPQITLEAAEDGRGPPGIDLQRVGGEVR